MPEVRRPLPQNEGWDRQIKPEPNSNYVDQNPHWLSPIADPERLKTT